MPAPLGAERPPGLFELVAHVLHAGVDGRQGSEATRRVLGQQARHGRLARAGRAEEDRGAQPVVLDQGAKRRSRSEEMALADDLVQPGRAEPGRERRSDLELVFGGEVEEIGRATGAGAPRGARRHAPGVSDAPLTSVVAVA